MRLVPKQLLRAGMTGQVPYYGGRLSPAQAYAASHPSARPPESVLPVTGSTEAALRPVPGPELAQSMPRSPRAGNPADILAALQYLLDTGVITAGEYEGLRARVVT
jgi:hypothetical protein